MARPTEEKLKQMAERVETTDSEREKFIKIDMEEMKRHYETVSDKLWCLETRMVKMSGDQTESSCAIQSKLDALLRNTVSQDKAIPDKTAKQPGTKVDFSEPHCKKQEPLHCLQSITA